MNRTLRECPYIWAVRYISGDGYCDTAAYFTDQTEAEKFCRQHKHGNQQQVVQVTLWVDDDENYYDIKATRIDVYQDLHFRSAMAKLSDQEKRALGIDV